MDGRPPDIHTLITKIKMARIYLMEASEILKVLAPKRRHTVRNALNQADRCLESAKDIAEVQRDTE